LHTALEGRGGRGEDAAGGSGRWPSGADGGLVLEAGRTEGGGREQEVASALKSQSTAPRARGHGVVPTRHGAMAFGAVRFDRISPRHGGADVSS
jgi:hypothetical protein